MPKGISSVQRARAPAREAQVEPERSTDLAERICGLIASGKKLNDAAREVGFKSWHPVYEWMADDAQFRKQYRKARRAGRKGKWARECAEFLRARKASEGESFPPSTARARAREAVAAKRAPRQARAVTA